MRQASRRISQLPASPTLAISAKAKSLAAAGRDVLNLSAGEPDFNTPEFIRRAACEALERGETRYTPADGTAELKQAIVDKFKRENGLDYEANQVIATTGAKQALFNAALAALDPGDEVIIPAPYWVSYPAQAQLAGAEPVVVQCPAEQGFKLTPEALEQAITPKSRMLVLNSPGNPSGAVYSREELRALGAVLEKHADVLIVSDDIYEHLIYNRDKPFLNIAMAVPTLRDRTLVVNGVSKAYAMTGWRLGYAAGPAWLVGAMKKLQSQSTSNPATASQAGAVAALTGDQACVADMREAFNDRRDRFIAGINKVPGLACTPPDGAFYAFVDCRQAIAARKLENDLAFAEWLLEEPELAAVPGSAFGLEGFMRFSYACHQDTLDAAVQRLEKALG